MIKEQDGTKYYPVKCCNCDEEFHAALSIFQSGFGMLENGSGTCPNCRTHLSLEFKPNEQRQDSSLIKNEVK